MLQLLRRRWVVACLYLIPALAAAQSSAGRPCGAVRVAAAPVDTVVDAGTGAQSSLLHFVVHNGPQYPIPLRNARIDGEVRVSFTVDTTGHVVPGSAEVVAESHAAFGQSVCDFLERARLAPIVLGGRRTTVRVINQPFRFQTQG